MPWALWGAIFLWGLGLPKSGLADTVPTIDNWISPPYRPTIT